MERTAISGVAAGDALRGSPASLRALWRRLEPVTLARWLAERWTEIALAISACSSAVIFARFALDRHRSYESTGYDLGFFDQVIWNTAHGRFYETNFVRYNFLGQHFQPVLLLFAFAYRLGAGVETLFVVQSLAVGAAAVPLFYAVRRATGSGIASLAMSTGFLFSAPLHRALDFDFHPELVGFFFVFLAAYYLIAQRPTSALLALLPLLALKEDMPLVLAAFAGAMYVRGSRRHAAALGSIAVLWSVVIVLVAMPLIRGGTGGDLTQRYTYLFDGSTFRSVIANLLVRGADHLWYSPIAAFAGLQASLGLGAFVSPQTLAVSAPSFVLDALSEHRQQSRFDLHYAMAPLALSWVAAVVGLARFDVSRSLRRAIGRGIPCVVLISSIATFAASSPYSPFATRYEPEKAHREIIREALSRITPDASVSAQSTLLPHLSSRDSIYEFPRLKDAEYVVVDPSLPVGDSARDEGYEGTIERLPTLGYEPVFSRAGVQVFRRLK